MPPSAFTHKRKPDDEYGERHAPQNGGAHEDLQKWMCEERCGRYFGASRLASRNSEASCHDQSARDHAKMKDALRLMVCIPLMNS